MPPSWFARPSPQVWFGSDTLGCRGSSVPPPTSCDWSRLCGTRAAMRNKEVLSRIDSLAEDIERLSAELAAIQLDEHIAWEHEALLESPASLPQEPSSHPETSSGLAQAAAPLAEPEYRPMTPAIRRYAGLVDEEQSPSPMSVKILYHSCPAELEAVPEEPDSAPSGRRAEEETTNESFDRSARGAAQARQCPVDGVAGRVAGRSRAPAARRKSMKLSIAISKVRQLKAEPVSPKCVPHAQEVWGRRLYNGQSSKAEPARSADAIKERIECKLHRMFGDSTEAVNPALRRKFKSIQ